MGRLKQYNVRKTKDPYKDLAIAITKQAVDIYADYLQHGIGSGERFSLGKNDYESALLISYSFLKSEEPYFYTGIEGETIIKTLEQRYLYKSETYQDKFKKYKEKKK